VQQLTGQDASFIYNETPTQHMHTLKIAVVVPPEGTRDPYEVLRIELRRRLDLLPPFRRRVVSVPLHLSHPWWVEDPEFDLDRHLRHVTLPAPGNREQFDALISRIAGAPLDRSRPLWEIWVVEGLEDGRVGIVAKIHHSSADGVTAADLLTAVASAEDRPQQPPQAAPWLPDAVPTTGQLLWWAARDGMQRLRALPGLLARTLHALWTLVRHRRSRGTAAATPFTGAKLSFNRGLSADRVFVSATLSLDRVKSVKKAFGVTVNDVILALCAGALRAYLAERDELPTRPLVAGVPVSTRGDDQPVRANSVSNLFVSLPVQLAEPADRIAAIHESTKDAKHVHNLLGVDLLADWSEMTPGKPYNAFMKWYSGANLADRGRPPINVIVSNVPGPRDPIYISGTEIVALCSMGPILEGIGLNFTVWSYRDELHVGAVSCPQLIPDLRRLVDGLASELDVLEATAPGR
jgi:diacylglycerol O-acyltransferase / wax synthase